MLGLHTFTLFSISSVLFFHAQAQLTPQNAPDKTQEGQTGTNKCGTDSSQTSMCQNAYLNALDDFCLYAPAQPGPQSTIGETEREEVAWCTKSGKGTRLIPDGAITGAHFVQTPDFVQITGIGNLTLLNIPAGDEGGELDPHGADGNGNPIGGLVFSTAFGGGIKQVKEWTNFMSADQFCFRACNPAGPRAATFCQHIYDVMGCAWNMPASYETGFDACKADSGEPMGVYGSSTFHQGEPVTPEAHPPPPSSSCVPTSSIGNGLVVGTPTSTVMSTPTNSAQGTGASTRTNSVPSTISQRITTNFIPSTSQGTTTNPTSSASADASGNSGASNTHGGGLLLTAGMTSMLAMAIMSLF